MGSKVNVKFVAILSAVLVGVVGLLAVPAYFVLTKSAADHIIAGDKALEAGEIKKAISEYGKAVNDERSNPDYVRKWRDAIEQYTPEDQTEFRKYFLQLFGAVYELARASGGNLEAWDEYFRFALVADSSARTIERARAASEMLHRTNPQNAAIVRRYMALPILRDLVGGVRQLEADEIDILEEDLRGVLVARSDDAEVVRGLVSLHRFLAQRALADLDKDAAAVHARQAMDAVDEALAAHPDHPILQMTRLEILASGGMRRLLEGEPEPSDTLVDLGELDRIASSLEAWPVEDIGLDDLGLLQGLEILSGSGRIDRTLALTERIVREDPDNMLGRWGRAFALRSSGLLEEAYEQLQIILDRPMQKISIEGFRQFSLQNQALATQSEVAFEQWERAGEDQDAAQSAMERMVSRYEEMTRRLPQDSPLLLLADARIAFAGSEFVEAGQKLREFETRVGSDNANANWMLAQLAIRANNLTEAGRRLDSYLLDNSGEVRALLVRADIHARLKEYDEALEILERLRRGLPNNEQIGEMIHRIKVVRGEIADDDPVLAVINESIRIERGTQDEPGNPARAIEVVERAISAGNQATDLYRRLSQLRLSQDDLEGARQAIASGVRANPGDEKLTEFQRLLQSGETVLDISISFIDAGEGTPVEKLSAKAWTCWQNIEVDRSRAFYDQGIALDPEYPRLVELGFRFAILDGDLAKAREIAETAQRIDLDEVGGRTLLAEVLLRENDRAGAIALLSEAVEMRPERIDLLQRLGRLQLVAGRTTEGLETYQTAMRLRGNEPSLILDFARQLRAIGRADEALRLLIEKQPQTEGNSTIFDLRVDLEGEIGNRQWALQTRRTLAQRDPSNRSNRIKLVKLQMDLAMWDESKPMLDALRDEGDSIQLATLAAEWHGDQGDIESARTEFNEYISALFAADGDLESPAAYLQLGQLLIRYGDQEGGLQAIAQARRWEDPANLRVEKYLGDQLAAMGRWAEAIESFRKIVDADRDTPDRAYTLRLAESLGRLGEHEEAEQVLATIAAQESTNVTILLLRSQNAAQLDEMDRARDLVQRAIELFPDSATAYVQRARLAMMVAQETGSEQMLRDAREDLAIAVTRDPAFVDAYLLRSQISAYLGELETMISDLRDAVFARPPTTEVVTTAIKTFSRSGRSGLAVEIADHAISLRPNNPTLLREIGSAFALTGDFGRASNYFRQAWERSKDTATSLRYVESLLLEDPPRHRVVMEVLGQLGDMVRDTPGLLIARSEALYLGSQRDFAIEDARRAFALLVQNPAGMSRWFSEVNRIFKDRNDLVAVVDAAKRGGQHRLLLDLFLARGLSIAKDDVERALPRYDTLIAQTTDPAIQRSAYVFKGAALLQHERYQEAVDVWIEGLARHPEEWQFHNNIAYVLGERLGRPDEALPYAQQAFEKAPQVAAVVDTLGWIQHLSGDNQAAELALEEAIRLIGAPENDETVALHLAIVQAAMGKKDLALNLVRTIRVLSQNGANLDETDRELLDEATALIDALP